MALSTSQELQLSRASLLEKGMTHKTAKLFQRSDAIEQCSSQWWTLSVCLWLKQHQMASWNFFFGEIILCDTFLLNLKLQLLYDLTCSVIEDQNFDSTFGFEILEFHMYCDLANGSCIHIYHLVLGLILGTAVPSPFRYCNSSQQITYKINRAGSMD